MKDNAPVISVIVPVYQAEDSLERCVSSIAEQSYKNLQIVLIDDGSSDRSPEICDEWASQDARVVVIHQPNGGVGAARNTGIQAATGSYIGWVDSDDWIDADYFASLYEKLHQNDADMVSSQSWAKSDVVLRGKEILKRQIMAELGVLWSSLAKAELFAGKSFGDYPVCEDGMMLMQICADCTTYVVSDIAGYHYTQRSGSASNSYDVKTVMGRFDAMDARNEFVRTHYPDFYRYVHYTSVLDAAKVHRHVRNTSGPEVSLIEKRVRKTIAAHLFKVPLGTLNRVQLREWLAGAKILMTVHEK